MKKLFVAATLAASLVLGGIMTQQPVSAQQPAGEFWLPGKPMEPAQAAAVARYAQTDPEFAEFARQLYERKIIHDVRPLGEEVNRKQLLTAIFQLLEYVEMRLRYLPPGPRGPQGPKGDPGAPGIQGPPGRDCTPPYIPQQSCGFDASMFCSLLEMLCREQPRCEKKVYTFNVTPGQSATPMLIQYEKRSFLDNVFGVLGSYLGRTRIGGTSIVATGGAGGAGGTGNGYGAAAAAAAAAASTSSTSTTPTSGAGASGGNGSGSSGAAGPTIR